MLDTLSNLSEYLSDLSDQQIARMLIRGNAITDGISRADKRNIVALLRALRNHPLSSAYQVTVRSLLESYRDDIEPKLPVACCLTHKRSRDVSRALFLAKLTPMQEDSNSNAGARLRPPPNSPTQLRTAPSGRGNSIGIEMAANNEARGHPILPSLRASRNELASVRQHIQALQNDMAGRASSAMLMAGIHSPQLEADLASLDEELALYRQYEASLENRITQRLIRRYGGTGSS